MRAVFIFLIMFFVITGLTLLFVGWYVWSGSMKEFVFPPLYGFGSS